VGALERGRGLEHVAPEVVRLATEALGPALELAAVDRSGELFAADLRDRAAVEEADRDRQRDQERTDGGPAPRELGARHPRDGSSVTKSDLPALVDCPCIAVPNA
jgi:hypothetical protein